MKSVCAVLVTSLAIATGSIQVLIAGDCNFVTDMGVREVPQTPKPGYLEPYMDPVFGTKVIRVTDPGEAIHNVGGTWGTVARHHYSLDQAWSADEALIILDRGTTGGKLYLDGTTYQPLFLRAGPGDDRWHPTIPDVRIYVKDNKIGTWNVRTQQVNVEATFPGYSAFAFGPNKGNPSRDGGRLAVLATAPNGGKVGFAYDRVTHQKFPDINLDGVSVSWVGVSALGNFVVMHESSSDRTRIYDLLGNQVGPYWSEYGRPSHFDLTVDGNGDEVAVGVSKSNPDNGLVIKRRLIDGYVTTLTDYGYASHTSARNIRQPGWVYVSYNCDPGHPPFCYEVVSVKLDGSKAVRRLFHNHRAENGYLTETHPCPSPDGTRVIWASNWDDLNGTVASYVTELCPDVNVPVMPNPPSSLNVAVVSSDTLRLSWVPPSTYSDGSPLSGGLSYEIYDGTSSGQYTMTTKVGDVSEATLGNLSPGQYYISMKTIDSHGVYSVFSQEVVASIEVQSNPNPPNPPSPPPSDGVNLVGNPSFEQDTSGWKAYGSSKVHRIAGGFDGSFALQVDGPSSPSSFGINDSPNWVSKTPAAGTHYRITAWVRSDVSRSPAQLKIREYLSGARQGDTTKSLPVTLSSSWQTLSLDYFSLVAGSTLDLQVVLNSLSAAESFSVDMISIEIVP